jgi:hypothetical protein
MNPGSIAVTVVVGILIGAAVLYLIVVCYRHYPTRSPRSAQPAALT